MINDQIGWLCGIDARGISAQLLEVCAVDTVSAAGFCGVKLFVGQSYNVQRRFAWYTADSGNSKVAVTWSATVDLL